MTTHAPSIRNLARIAGSLSIAFGIASSALAQDLGIKAPTQSDTVAIDNATIHTITGKPIEKGFVLFKNGVIESVGSGPMPATSDQVRIIDGTGRHVYPGLIAAYSQLGLTEIAAVRATLDMGEVGPGTPEVRAATAVNPDSSLLPVTRSNGVLIAGIFPRTNSTGQLAYFSGPGGLFPGRASVMRLEGWTWEQMAILDDAGQVINWPFPRAVDAWWMNKSREDQQSDIDRSLKAIEDMLTGARQYASATSEQPRDVRFDAMRSIFPREKQPQRPVFVEANDVDAIRQAALVCQRFNLKCVIVGGRDAVQCADLLTRLNISVILDGTWKFPKRDDLPYDDIFSLPARLEAAGVSWCLSSGEEAANERNLPYAAGAAVAYGLDPGVALEAITIRPARILGISDAHGSIEQGKSATLILADGDILEITTNIQAAFIDGRTLDMSDKHKALAAKYREKYRQLKASPATHSSSAPDAASPKSPAPTPAAAPPAPVSPQPAGDTPPVEGPR